MISEFVIEHKEEIGTIMGAFVVYIGAEILKWYKSRKTTKVVRDNVEEILKGQNVFHDKINNDVSEIKSQVSKMESDIKDVRKEVMFNGGHSMKDQLSKVQNNLSEMQGLQEARFFAQQNQQLTATYNCDVKGNCTFSNTALSNLFGMHYSEMIGKGWLRAIGLSQSERESVYEEWMNAVRNDLPFECIYNVVNQKTGDQYKCKTKADAQRKKDGTVMFYLGTVIKI